MRNVHFQFWDERRFLASRDDWQKLLARSDADRLFLSWEWQSSWWQVFADSDMQLRLLTASDEQGRLLAIAPLYLCRVSNRGISSRRLQFIGNCWRQRETMPTELLDFIIDRDHVEQLLPLIFQQIQQQSDWDELVLAYFSKDSASYRCIEQWCSALKGVHRIAEQRRSWYLPLPREMDTCFSGYLAERGKNTRLRLYNRRRRLAAMGEVHFETGIDRDIDQQFEDLNALHRQRWQQKAFGGQRLAFNRLLAERMAERRALSFSRLALNGHTFSMQYNYRIDGHVYNIQAGFENLPDKKIAPGYLHFGYEIEAACQRGDHCYDFLAGGGQHGDYKTSLTGHSLEVIDLQIIRKPLLQLLYRLYALLPGRS